MNLNVDGLPASMTPAEVALGLLRCANEAAVDAALDRLDDAIEGLAPGDALVALLTEAATLTATYRKPEVLADIALALFQCLLAVAPKAVAVAAQEADPDD